MVKERLKQKTIDFSLVVFCYEELNN